MSDEQTNVCKQIELDAEMETIKAALRETLDAISELYAWQNGCPLPSWEEGWGDAMKKAGDVLDKYEAPHGRKEEQ